MDLIYCSTDGSPRAENNPDSIHSFKAICITHQHYTTSRKQHKKRKRRLKSKLCNRSQKKYLPPKKPPWKKNQGWGLLYWFTELCVVEVFQNNAKWSFYVNKRNYWPQNIPPQLWQPLSSTETTCVTADFFCFPFIARWMINYRTILFIYLALIFHLSRNNFLVIARWFIIYRAIFWIYRALKKNVACPLWATVGS